MPCFLKAFRSFLRSTDQSVDPVLTHDSTGSRKVVFLQGGDQLLMLFGRTTFAGICDIVHVFNSRHMAFKCLNEAF